MRESFAARGCQKPRKTIKRNRWALTILMTAMGAFTGCSYAASDVDGTASGGKLSVEAGEYKQIVGFRQTQDQPLESSASLTFEDSFEKYSVVKAIHALVIENMGQTELSGIGSNTTLKNIQMRFFGSGSGEADKYLDAVFVSPAAGSQSEQSLELRSNSLKVVDGSQIEREAGTLSLAAVAAGNSNVLDLKQLLVEGNSTAIEGSRLSVSSVAAVHLSSTSGEDVHLYNNSLRAENSYINGTVYGAMGRPSVGGEITANGNSIEIIDSTVDGYLRGFDTTGVNYKKLVANDNRIRIDRSTINNSSNVLVATAQQVAGGVSETFFSGNVIEINDSSVNGLYAVSTQTMTSGSGYMKNDYYLNGNKIIARGSQLSGTGTYASYASITSWTPQDEGGISIKDSEISFERTIFDGKYLHAAYAASRAGSSSVEGTKVSYVNSKIKPSQYSYDSLIFATNGGGATVSNSLTTVDSSTLVGLFGSAALSVNNGYGRVLGNRYVITGASVLEGDFYLADVTAPEIEIVDNSFLVEGSADLKKANLCGYTISQSQNARIENNAIIFSGWDDGDKNSVLSLQNFNQIKFGTILWRDQGSVVTVLTGENSLSNTSVAAVDNAWVLESPVRPAAGEYMYLIDGSVVSSNPDQTLGLSPDNFDSSVNFYLKDSALVEGEATLSLTDDGSLKMTIDEYSVSDQSLILVENRVAAVAFLNNGNDLIIDSLDIAGRSGTSPVGFALIQGEALRYDTASSIKINGFHSIFGSGVNIDDQWNLTGFFETGSANYRTQNVFVGESFRGDGEMAYWGLGLAAKYKITPKFSTHVGLQFGRMKTDISNAIRNSEGEFFDVRDYAWYWSGQIGLNWSREIQTGTVGLYARYMHSQLAGGSTNAGKDQLDFDAVQSDRFRLGVKNAIEISDQSSINLGLGWDYEANAKARMSIGDIEAPTQSLQGSTGFAEVGGTWSANGFAVEGRVRGFAGVISGWEGQIRGSFTF